jgi:NAD(P)-dependent dehydrogenase (short-subunit alcohol dehydrogenase family)
VSSDFAGKVVLVTGGTSGLGRAAALAFARRGARVAIAGRREEAGRAVCQEIGTHGGEAVFFQADVSRPRDVDSLVASVIAGFGRLDAAFNNAASLEAGVFTPLADVTDEEFDRHMAVNLKSVWSCMKHEIAQMLRQGTGGTIVNTSSVNGLGGVAQNGLYAAAKAGVIALTKSAAQEYAAQGIRVNALVAGGFRTPMLESVFERLSPGKPSAAETGFAAMVPLGRIGRPEEAAEAVVWLCSGAASYVTGHSMIVDGGVTSSFR